MPLPPIPDWIGRAGSGCGNTTVSLTLDNIRLAIAGATPEERNAFAATLFQDCNVALMTGDSLATAFNNSADYHYDAITADLRKGSDYVNSHDLVHAMGNATLDDAATVCVTFLDKDNDSSPWAKALTDIPLEIQAMVGCADLGAVAASVNQEDDCLKAQVDKLVPIVDGQRTLTHGFEDILRDILVPILRSLIHVQIVCDPALPPGLSATIAPQGVIIITLNLFGIVPCGGEGGGVGVADDNVKYFPCGTGHDPTNLNVPMLADAQGNTQAPLFQLIIDKLSNLESCCPPCRNTERLILTGIQGVGDATLPADGDKTTYEEIYFEITQAGAQRAADFSNPPRWKYGTFTWVYGDGTHSHPQFVNYNFQRFFTPRDEITAYGIAWHLEPGIVANVFGAPLPPWRGGVVYD